MTTPASLLIFALALLAQPASAAVTPQSSEQLAAIEAASHHSWHKGDLDALAELMALEFHFIAMNGAVETRAEVLGEGNMPDPGAHRRCGSEACASSRRKS